MAYEFTFNFLRVPRFSAWHSWLPLTPVSEAPEVKEPERTLSKFLLSGIAVIELAVLCLLVVAVYTATVRLSTRTFSH